MKLHPSGEDYFEAVLILEQKKSAARSVDVAEQLGVSKPGVSRAVSLLREGGFLRVEDNSLYLTDAGHEVSEKIYERHCFFKNSLLAAGVDEVTAEKEACLLEHDLSDDSFVRIKNASVQADRSQKAT